LTDFDEIWNDDAHWPSEIYGPKKSKFKNSRWQNLKIVIYLFKFRENVE